MNPWDEKSDVNFQWKESEYEELTPLGHKMIDTLGTWFAKRYCKKNDTKGMYRCSKSGRAKESGADFIKAFNLAISKEVSLSFTTFGYNILLLSRINFICYFLFFTSIMHEK